MNIITKGVIETARNLFEETVRENYFDSTLKEENSTRITAVKYLYCNSIANYICPTVTVCRL